MDEYSNDAKLLGKLTEPSDLRHFNRTALEQIAREVRSEIIKTVSKNGGHLGSSLGVVELAISLHYVFNSPVDRIVWDTGHQAYAHKILTGRGKDFHTLRQHKGLSGFCSIFESRHDAFGAGHASTSISAALGIAKARDIKGEDYKVIAIIGDGCLTGGLAFEGLNNAGSLKSDLIVILNDNKMSISPNVGAVSTYLNRAVLSKKYFDMLKRTEIFLRRIPAIGNERAKRLVEIQQKLRIFGSPGLIFNELGFKYFGPIDGHNIDELTQALNNIKDIKGPVLLHVRTIKGKGYRPAEKNSLRFHGVSQFNIEDGEIISKSSTQSYTQVFGKTMVEIAELNEKAVAVTAAMTEGTGLAEFSREFPERFFDVGIAEEHAVTFAAGLAVNCLRPYCIIYSTFMQRAYDQAIHDVCLQRLPVVFCMDRAGFVGDDGPTHAGMFDIAYMRTIPGIVVMAPKDENELRHMVYTTLFIEGPSAIRYPRGEGTGARIDERFKRLAVGKAELLREGKDILIIALGPLVHDALQAAKESGKSVSVINARFVKPLDEKLITGIAKKTGRVITIEEGTVRGGMGSAILEMLAEHNICAKVKVMGIPDRFVEHASQAKQREIAGLNKEGILKAINEVM